MAGLGGSPSDALSRLAAAALLVSVVSACQAGGPVAPGAGGPVAIGDRDGDLIVVGALAPPAGAFGPARIAAGDLLAVDVFNADELDRRPRVDTQGAISMPLIGAVPAAGLTAAELAERLETAYGRDFLRAPDITVDIVESAARRMTLDGEFARPGIFAVDGQTTLLRAVALAGGLTDIADPRRIFVFRPVPQGRQVAQYALSDIRAARAPDIRLYGGDVVIAFPSGPRVAARNLREALGLAGSAARLAPPP